VLPDTDPSVLERLVELVHTEGRADGNSAASTAGAGKTAP
jgi:hypothetical protein